MRILKKNCLFIAFITIQIIFFILSMFSADGIDEVAYPVQAMIMHIASTLSFSLGYFLGNKNVENKKSIKIKHIGKRYLFFFLGLFFLGLVTSVVSICVVIPLSEYLQLILNGDILAIKMLREQVGTSGLPGYLKVLNYAPLGVFLVSSSYYFFCEFEREEDKKKLLKLLCGILIILMFKVVFSLERLTLLAILPVLGYAVFKFSKKQKLWVFFFLGLLLALLVLVTHSRMGDRTIFSFLVLYANLGMSNFQLLIEHFTDRSYGFNTLLMPLYFIGKTFGVEIEVPVAPVSIWGNPQYFFGYLYMDYGYFMLIVLVLLGFLLARYQKLINERDPWAISFFFLSLFVVHTTMVIPIIRAVEFWLLILIAMMGKYLLKFKI